MQGGIDTSSRNSSTNSTGRRQDASFSHGTCHGMAVAGEASRPQTASSESSEPATSPHTTSSQNTSSSGSSVSSIPATSVLPGKKKKEEEEREHQRKPPRVTWHRPSADLPTRKHLLKEIMRVLQIRWRCPDGAVVARRIEGSLYRAATSRAAYEGYRKEESTLGKRVEAFAAANGLVLWCESAPVRLTGSELYMKHEERPAYRRGMQELAQLLAALHLSSGTGRVRVMRRGG